MRGQRFGNFMYTHGMRAYHTVMKRFAADDWREWERIGIRQFAEMLTDKYCK